MIILLSILFILSVAIIWLLVWYIKQLLTKLWFISDNIGSLMDMTDRYQERLESIYTSDLYYGEPVIQELINHTKFIIEEIKKYKDIYSLSKEDGGENTQIEGE